MKSPLSKQLCLLQIMAVCSYLEARQSIKLSKSENEEEPLHLDKKACFCYFPALSIWSQKDEFNLANFKLCITLIAPSCRQFIAKMDWRDRSSHEDLAIVSNYYYSFEVSFPQPQFAVLLLNSTWSVCFFVFLHSKLYSSTCSGIASLSLQQLCTLKGTLHRHFFFQNSHSFQIQPIIVIAFCCHFTIPLQLLWPTILASSARILPFFGSSSETPKWES